MERWWERRGNGEMRESGGKEKRGRKSGTEKGEVGMAHNLLKRQENEKLKRWRNQQNGVIRPGQLIQESKWG